MYSHKLDGVYQILILLDTFLPLIQAISNRCRTGLEGISGLISCVTKQASDLVITEEIVFLIIYNIFMMAREVTREDIVTLQCDLRRT